MERVQTGVRIEARLLKVLKALAEMKSLSLGDLLEGICLHAFEGRVPFSASTRAQITQLASIYGMDLTAEDSHRLVDRTPTTRSRSKASPSRRAPRSR